MTYYYDDGFKLFAQALSLNLANNPDYTEYELAVHQRSQIQTLVALEDKFRKALLANKKGPATYTKFVKYICQEKGNILSARPYFRERQTVFTKYISPALKTQKVSKIYKFRINWLFISWVLKQDWVATSGATLRALADQINACRQTLLQENLPLSISQAKQFYAATSRSHLTFMDLVQIQAQGLLLAIDKFVPPDKSVKMTEAESLDAYRSFRAVAIGIMSRDRVNEYSQTLMHFYPKDKQLIYWANKMLRKYIDQVDHDEISREINLNLPAEEKTDGKEIANLLAASGVVSADYASEPEGETVIESAVAEESWRPDVATENTDLLDTLHWATAQLSVFESKLLKLQGIKS